VHQTVALDGERLVLGRAPVRGAQMSEVA